MMRHLLSGALVVTLGAATAAARGQEPPAPPGAQAQRPLAGGQAGDLSPAEIQRLFDGMMLMDAQDALSLSEKQYPEFIIRLRAMQETRRRNQQARMQVMGDLQRMTNPRNAARGEDAAIRQRLTELQELDSRAAAELRKAYTALDEILDVRQQARFRLFEEQLERRRFELLMRARQNRQAVPPRRPQD